MIQTRKHEVFNDEDDADANEYGDDHDNNNEGDSDGNGNCQIRSGVPRKGCLIICLFISFIQVKTKKYPFIFSLANHGSKIVLSSSSRKRRKEKEPKTTKTEQC